MDDGPNTYAYVLNNPLKYIDPTGEIAWVPIMIAVALIYGSQSNNFQNQAASSAQYWANKQQASGNPLFAIPGALASLADPCNINTTVSVLGVGAGLGAWGGRPFWQYYPANNPAYNSAWLTRGWGWKPPYSVGKQAQQKLALPPYNTATAVKPVNPTGFVGGPGKAGAYYGQPGGGVEYLKNGWPKSTP